MFLIQMSFGIPSTRQTAEMAAPVRARAGGAWFARRGMMEGTAGTGSGQHVSGIYFQKVTGTQFQFVPYRAGSSEVMRDLIAGHIDLSFDQAITALPHVRNGSVKAYAVTSGNRLAAAGEQLPR